MACRRETENDDVTIRVASLFAKQPRGDLNSHTMTSRRGEAQLAEAPGQLRSRMNKRTAI